MPVVSSTATSVNSSMPACSYSLPSSSRSRTMIVPLPARRRRPPRAAAAAQQLVARLCDVDVDRVELTDRGQRVRLVRGHQRAGRVDRSRDLARIGAVIRVYSRLMRAVSSAARAAATSASARPCAALGVVVLLLRHRLDLDEFRVALGQQPGRRERRLGPRERRLGAVIVGLVQRRIDLVQHLPGLDLLALREQAPLDEAANLRAHFGDHDRHRYVRATRRSSSRARSPK